MASENSARLAVLIDADNAQPSITEGLLAEVAKYGTAHVKRAYGDWTGPNLKGWKDHLLAQSIQPIQQFAYTKGKNATDAAMVIDAMDLLYSGRFDGFCIVSSDSDFTRLAARLRESALTVYGFGERKTPKPFVAACDKFIYIENLTFADSDTDADAVIAGSPGAESKPARPRSASAAQLKGDTMLVALLRNAVEAASDDDGWASLSAIGNIITNQRPDFDSRSYGYAKLSDLITATTLFEMDRRSPGDGKQAQIFARAKRRQPARRAAKLPAVPGPVRDRQVSGDVGVVRVRQRHVVHRPLDAGPEHGPEPRVVRPAGVVGREHEAVREPPAQVAHVPVTGMHHDQGGLVAAPLPRVPRRPAHHLRQVGGEPLDVPRVLARMRERVVQFRVRQAARVQRGGERREGRLPARELVQRRLRGYRFHASSIAQSR